MNDSDTKKKLIELAEGVYVERDVLNIVEKLQQYDPNLKIKYCDPDRADLFDAPYRVVELCPDGVERIVFDAWEINETILDRIYAADTFKHDIVAQIDSQNALAKRNQKQRFVDVKLEAQDIVSHYLASPKGRYTFKDSVTEKTVTLSDDPNEKAKVKDT